MIAFATPVTPQTAGPGDVLVNVHTGRLYILDRWAPRAGGRLYIAPLGPRRRPFVNPGGSTNLKPADCFGIAIHPDAEDQEVAL